MITLKTFDHTPRLAELKIAYKRTRGRRHKQASGGYMLRSELQVAEYLRTIWDDDTIDLREEFVLLCLDTSLTVLGWVKLHTGSLDASLVDPRLVFGVALQTASAAIIVAHNHPSGNVEPSVQDITLTKRLAEGAKLLGLRFVDHLILNRNRSFSFASAGLLDVK